MTAMDLIQKIYKRVEIRASVFVVKLLVNNISGNMWLQ